MLCLQRGSLAEHLLFGVLHTTGVNFAGVHFPQEKASIIHPKVSLPNFTLESEDALRRKRKVCRTPLKTSVTIALDTQLSVFIQCWVALSSRYG